MQFARFGGNALNDDGKVKAGVNAEDTMKAFRNAYDNGKTANTTEDFLYGEAGDGLNINWTGIKGTARVILRKVNSSYEPLENAGFELYRGETKMAWPDMTDTAGNPVTVLTSQTSGVLWIGDLPYGEYYLKETNPPTDYSSNQKRWFCLIVEAGGTYMSKAGYETQAAAKTDAEAIKNGTGSSDN